MSDQVDKAYEMEKAIRFVVREELVSFIDDYHKLEGRIMALEAALNHTSKLWRNVGDKT